jgi:hypothetical protein
MVAGAAFVIYLFFYDRRRQRAMDRQLDDDDGNTIRAHGSRGGEALDLAD